MVSLSSIRCPSMLLVSFSSLMNSSREMSMTRSRLPDSEAIQEEPLPLKLKTPRRKTRSFTKPIRWTEKPGNKEKAEPNKLPVSVLKGRNYTKI